MAATTKVQAAKAKVQAAKAKVQAAKVAALGWSIGGRCVSVIEHGSINLRPGDEGTVVGPCNSDAADRAERVLVDFGQGKGKVNIPFGSSDFILVLNIHVLYAFDSHIPFLHQLAFHFHRGCSGSTRRQIQVATRSVAHNPLAIRSRIRVI